MNDYSRIVYVVTASESRADGSISTHVLGIVNTEPVAYGLARNDMHVWAEQHDAAVDADSLQAHNDSTSCCWQVHAQTICC